MSELKAIAVIEKDVNDDVILVWSFPALPDPETHAVLMSRCGLKARRISDVPFKFSKFRDNWQYILTQRYRDALESAEMKTQDNKQKQVLELSVIVIAEAFNPEKYEALLKLFTKVYVSTGTPVKMAEAYLKLFTTNKLGNSFDGSSFDDRKALIAAPFCDLIRLFGVEWIIIWSAMLLKKRVFVYCESLPQLLDIVRIMPLLVWHRQDWSILRPIVNMTDEELEDLTTSGIYVAGFTDPNSKNKTDMYDLFVDVSSRKLDISQDARSDFRMSKFHKELATTVSSQVVDEEGNEKQVNDQTLIKAVSLKTKDLITKLNSLKSEHDDGTYITPEDVMSAKLPKNMKLFLYNVALAEKMTKD